jgi:hypothetical protein
MAVTFGVGTLPLSITAPTDTVIKSMSVKESIDTYQYRDETGITKKLIPGNLITKEVTLEVLGKPALADVAATEILAVDTKEQVSAKFTQNNEGMTEGSVTFKAFVNKA